MNIFVLHRDPQEAARLHCDKHVVKMIVETAQLLSSAVHAFGEAHADRSAPQGWSRILPHPQEHLLPDQRGPLPIYSATHSNHPCAVWVREASGNYVWTVRLLVGLLEEYQRRYGDESGKRHAVWALLPSLEVVPMALMQATPPELAADGTTLLPRTPFKTVVPDDILEEHTDPVKAYRAYYRKHKVGMARWKIDNQPEWMT